MARTLRYHIYIPGAGYEIQGPTYETGKPLDRKQKQKMLEEFFDWMRGDQQTLKRQVATGLVPVVFDEGYGTRLAVIERIESMHGFTPPKGLGADDYRRIYRKKWRSTRRADWYVERDEKGRFKKWYKLRERRYKNDEKQHIKERR